MFAAPRADLNALVCHLSHPSTFAQTGVHHGYRQALVVTAGRVQLPKWTAALVELEPVAEAWVSWIEPGGYIVEHQDAGPYLERWQIPLTEAGALYENGVPVPHVVGVPFRVHQWDWHHVRNDTDQPRVSLVVDRNVRVDVPSGPFRVR